MRVVADRLSLRWYLGYDLTEPLPDHSSLTRIRERYGLEVFRRFFEAIVEQCVAAGLVWGQELYIDSTKVAANAALDSLAARASPSRRTSPLFSPDPRRRRRARTAGLGKRAGPPPWPCRPLRLGYHDHYVVDGGRVRIVLAALVTPTEVMENQPMLRGNEHNRIGCAGRTRTTAEHHRFRAPRCPDRFRRRPRRAGLGGAAALRFVAAKDVLAGRPRLFRSVGRPDHRGRCGQHVVDAKEGPV